MAIREDTVHVALRRFLQRHGWQLVAGQYPNGSDDLPPLNIMDPTLAGDNSPDPRRHSKNKFVPDLVACKGQSMLIIEMKPSYSLADEIKLEMLFGERREDLIYALSDLVTVRGVLLCAPIYSLQFIPCLGFGFRTGSSVRYRVNPKFCYFLVADLATVHFEGNGLLDIN